MKSRFLASTIIMLLGLLSTNLFGQVTNTASVDFLLMNPVESSFRTSTDVTAREDTVGRQAIWQVTWEAGSQAKENPEGSGRARKLDQ